MNFQRKTPGRTTHVCEYRVEFSVGEVLLSTTNTSLTNEQNCSYDAARRLSSDFNCLPWRRTNEDDGVTEAVGPTIRSMQLEWGVSEEGGALSHPNQLADGELVFLWNGLVCLSNS